MTTTDLAAWLTAVWDEEERLLKRAFEILPTPRTRTLLARVAADRKILAAYQQTQVASENWEDNQDDPAELDGRVQGLRIAVRLLASAYSDRPGFRSEWLVERQGVEQ